MRREEFQKGLINLAANDGDFARIDPFATLSPRQVAAVLNVPIGSLRHGRQGTDVLTRIDVSGEGARRRTYQYNKREVHGLLRLRQQSRPSAIELAARIYDRVSA